MSTHEIELHRVYDGDAPAGTFRVLVDRLWPRGVRREDLHYDHWAKDLAPSPALRTWFGHRPERWDEFRRRYAAELATAPGQAALNALLHEAGARPITLLYGAKDTRHTHALVLREALMHAAGHRR